MAKQAVWLYGRVEDDVAEEIMQTIGGIDISDTSIWRRQEKWGERIKAHEELRRATASAMPARGAVVPGGVLPAGDMGMAMDGTMIHVREQGWKELKLAARIRRKT